MSILSPSNKWERNKTDAETLLESYFSGGSIDDFKVCTYGRNKAKAWRLLEDNLLVFESAGEKTLCFVDNIADPATSTRVTVDRWAARIAFNSKMNKIITVTRSIYLNLEKRYQKAAEHVGLQPHQLQAITWVTAKRMTEEAIVTARTEKASVPCLN